METLKKAYDRLTFQMKVIILTSLLICSIFFALSIYIKSVIAENIEDEVGKKALAVSNTIAQSPSVIAAFDEEHPESVIQPFTKGIQEAIDAEFIVVGNKAEVRYSHTMIDRIGKQMVGDDNKRALEKGESYVSKNEGSLGLSIRGKSPIIQDGEIIGVVSVGYLLTDVNQMVKEKNQPIIMLLITFLGVGLMGSLFIAKHLKKLLFHMEPYEIAEVLLQKNAILQSAKEGIIAVDSNNRITLMNHSAKEILQIADLDEHDIVKQPLTYFTDIPLLEYAADEIYSEDREYILNHDIVLLNIFALKEAQKNYGAVATFRKKTDLEKVTKELSTIKQYADGLRSQAHEFSNKTHTILGLLQLGHHEEAIEFIREDEEIAANRHQVIMHQITDPVIQGLLIAKYNQANEKGIVFDVNEESQLSKLSSLKHREVVLKVLGNLIDNACHAVREDPIISVFITDIGNDIIIEIDDNGPGISPKHEEKVFIKGYSTKNAKERGGTGLYLVKQAVSLLQGHIFLETSELSGARFVTIIPKGDSSHAED